MTELDRHHRCPSYFFLRGNESMTIRLGNSVSVGTMTCADLVTSNFGASQISGAPDVRLAPASAHRTVATQPGGGGAGRSGKMPGAEVTRCTLGGAARQSYLARRQKRATVAACGAHGASIEAKRQASSEPS